jgi:hypothetical protein
LANQEGIAGADSELAAALELVQSEVAPEVVSITERAQQRLGDDVAAADAEIVVAALIAFVTLIVLAGSQWFVFRRTNRLVNLPLALATILLVVGVVWLGRAANRQQDQLDTARRGGYDSIALSSTLQDAAYEYKTDESLLLIGDPTAGSGLAALGADVDRQLVAVSEAADSTREQAATTELLVRWQRYRSTSDQIVELVNAGDRVGAVELAAGSGNTDFNGFNTSVESVLSDNRTQFSEGVAAARDELDYLRPAMIALPVLAALLALWGVQLRLNEYR